jgi:2-amino-4-hydroxy-6-hydroxymethyldihydropteridine diphosphokinase
MQREWVSVFAGLGANLGDARRAIEDAVLAIGQIPETRVVNSSSLYRSAPVDAGGPDYCNAVVHLESRLNAVDLLKAFQAIENAAGRERPYINAPRTLDIDMLLYGSAQIQSSFLTVPHPRMMERAFVLKPLSEVAPHLVAPEDLLRNAHQLIQPFN